MSSGPQHSSHSEAVSRQGAQPIYAWETQYPETWLLLEITEEDEGEPVRGVLLATADDPDEVQEIWRTYRNKGVLTMLTYGHPREPRPEVVLSATSLGIISSLYLASHCRP